MKTAAGIATGGIVGIGGQIVIQAFAASGHPLGDDDRVLVSQIISGIVGLVGLVYALYQHLQTKKQTIALANEAVAAKQVYKATPSPLAASLETITQGAKK